MSLLDVPFLNGYKSAISGWGFLLGGLGTLLTLLGGALTGHVDLPTLSHELPTAVDAVVSSLAGLGILGIAHKIEKAGQGSN